MVTVATALAPLTVELSPLPEVPTVSVVMPALDAELTLSSAVASALTQEGDFRLVEVVVAVGPSRDRTAEVAAGLAALDARVTVSANPSGRTPQGLNAAIAASSGQVVVRLDAHAELPAGYVAQAVDSLRATGAANVGGTQVPAAAGGFARAVAAAMASAIGSGAPAYRTGGNPGEAETVYLGVFRREALAAVGGFDERLVRSQDYELNHRLRQAGGTVWFDPALAVAYRPRGDVGSLARQYLDYGRWKRAVLRLHPASVQPRQLAPPALLVAFVVTALVGLVTSAWWPLGMVAGVYLTVVVVAAAIAAPTLALAPATALAVAVMHVAWAVGFFAGAPRHSLDPPTTMRP